MSIIRRNEIEAVLPVSLQNVQNAAARICGYVRQTPLLESSLLNEVLGFRLLVKAECLQVTGSFKARGGFNQLLQLDEETKRQGIIAWSSGNHAQGVAYAAQKLGIKATILMPHDAPQLKMENTRRYGAEIVTYNRDTEDRNEVGNRLTAERGLHLIHSYDAERTIAGQGTVGLEIYNQTCEQGISPDALIVNCCGGGLSSGIAVTCGLYEKPPMLYTSEPQFFDDARRSLASGTMMKNDRVSGSICDALLMPNMGIKPLQILLHHGAQGLTASDDDAQAAMHVALEYFKLVLEPGGAVSLAAAFLNRQQFQGKTVVAVASGGNVDPDAYIDMLRRGRVHRAKLLPQLGR